MILILFKAICDVRTRSVAAISLVLDVSLILLRSLLNADYRFFFFCHEQPWGLLAITKIMMVYKNHDGVYNSYTLSLLYHNETEEFEKMSQRFGSYEFCSDIVVECSNPKTKTEQILIIWQVKPFIVQKPMQT